MSKKLSDTISHITLLGLLKSKTSQWVCVAWKKHRLTSVPANVDWVDRNRSCFTVARPTTWILGCPSQKEKKDKDLKPSTYYIAFAQLHTQSEPWLLLTLHSLQVLLLPLLIALSFLSLTLLALYYEKLCSDSEKLYSLHCCFMEAYREREDLEIHTICTNLSGLRRPLFPQQKL